MRGIVMAGACALALASFCTSEAIAKHGRSTKCAAPAEVTAIAATSIQQELMVAALTCNQIANFNAFQTNFGPELRASDRTLMSMFQRLYGGGRGAAEYHAFKTRLANNSEMRSIHGNQDFCSAAGLVFAAALAAAKPTLSDFVSGVQVVDPSPINSCQMQVTMSLTGAMAVPAILPRQKPAQFEDISLQLPAPPIPTVDAAGSPQPPNSTASATVTTAAAANAAATSPAATAATPTNPQATGADQPKKKKGFLSGLFN